MRASNCSCKMAAHFLESLFVFCAYLHKYLCVFVFLLNTLLHFAIKFSNFASAHTHPRATAVNQVLTPICVRWLLYILYCYFLLLLLLLGFISLIIYLYFIFIFYSTCFITLGEHSVFSCFCVFFFLPSSLWLLNKYCRKLTAARMPRIFLYA